MEEIKASAMSKEEWAEWLKKFEKEWHKGLVFEPIKEIDTKENTKGVELLAKLFDHVTKPSKEWPQTTIGKEEINDSLWVSGGVDDEFRDYLVSVEKYLNTK